MDKETKRKSQPPINWLRYIWFIFMIPVRIFQEKRDDKRYEKHVNGLHADPYDDCHRCAENRYREIEEDIFTPLLIFTILIIAFSISYTLRIVPFCTILFFVILILGMTIWERIKITTKKHKENKFFSWIIFYDRKYPWMKVWLIGIVLLILFFYIRIRP